ncbi:MAG: helix-turn-helix domain-containing protein [Xenococcaceae cyanobacterium]
MSGKRISAFDTNLAKSKPLVPKLPNISSAAFDWQNLVMEHHFLSASECPEMETEQLTLTIKIGNSFVTDWRLDGELKRSHMQRGDIAILAKGIVSSAVWYDRSEVLLLSIDSTLVDKIAEETLNHNSIQIIPQRQVRDLQIVNIALALKAELESGCLAESVYRDYLTNALIVYLLTKYSNRDRALNKHSEIDVTQTKIDRVKDYINDNLDENLNLSKIAEIANISTYHFARLFKQKTGYSPHQYIIQNRIEKAKNLLSKTNLSIVEIAYSVGYSSQSNFTSLFRKQVGTTPKKYRQSKK